MSSTASPSQPTSKRNLIRDMEEGGNALWVQTLAVFSLILRGPSSISHWRRLISSSSKGLLEDAQIVLGSESDQPRRRRKWQRQKAKARRKCTLAFLMYFDHFVFGVYLM
ncbi:hypothetical protein Nepgr_005524 [Nepenthes gracilis]|uniref:Uncharacterized protein n=1 Tax=Nepenthes gracilis TaxID=150966 RepID=A0AAD3S3C0_NEPGR|nr:hypothetical protein Nepgr_005524 [Nepenthes gracilis]